MKEIKVRLYRYEDDNFVELWKVIDSVKGEPRYYGRYMYHNEGTWYYVCDPLGYCELHHSVKDDVMFILCDEKGNEYLRYSNADDNPLPKLQEYIKMEWDKHKDKILHNVENHEKDFWAEIIYGETTLGINQWLLSFKDPDLYKKEIDDMYGYDENWLYCRTEEIKYEPIEGTEFTYLGDKYQFTKVTCRHKICGVEWIEYRCTDAPYRIDSWTNSIVSHYGNLGNWYDSSKIGAMYDKRTARNVIVKALEEIYPKENDRSWLLYVDESSFYKTLRKYSYGEAAEILLGKELHRDKVLEIANKEKTEHHFYLNTKENRDYINQKYSEIIDDTIWRW